jgi:hypothetical protein
VIGVLRDLTGSFASGLWYATALLAVSIVAMLSIRPRSRELVARPASAKA